MYSVVRLIKELPDNYEEECINRGAVRRWRGVKSPADLMLLILIHLQNGTSLLETSVIARTAKLGEISDVAFMKRLAQCKDWFVWICQALLSRSMENYRQPEWLAGRTVVAVDASDVVEKGATRQTYRLHFALDIFNMSSLQSKITKQSVGETLVNFDFRPNMLVIADRIYTTVRGMVHCLDAGADFVLRMRKNSFKTCGANGERLDLLSIFKDIESDGYADFTALAVSKDGVSIPVRICAKRKTPEHIEKTMKKLKLRERKCGVTDEAKLFNEYIVVVTSLGEEVACAQQILELYRLRWQVEIHFKRLKSILDLGELPKKKPEHSLAWLNGKLMVALLIESVIAKSFSPDGKQRNPDFTEHLEGDEDSTIVY
jgi:hypothetical protein